MPTCHACGELLSGEFRFCPFCGVALTEPPPVPVSEERKVVTVLFCDLVGFTAASDAADPEDVRSRIRPYYARVRAAIEAHGGMVENFVGDAVMAVFGSPVAHEDDAERAVRAGLRILEGIDELNEQDPALALQVRIGINTGEAVVGVGAGTQGWEGSIIGDVANTASRLQGAAPVNGIVCSEQTRRATERVFDYEQLEPVHVKGKKEPLAIWRPLKPRAGLGSDVTRKYATPLVGRELEKPLLLGAFERSARDRTCELVTIVGEPGVGKSRLCAELFTYIEERPELIRWRQGRCLPYGERVAFWALGEIVKAECGILESDSPQDAEAKLERALPQDDADLPWLRARLAPLVGAPAEPAPLAESFAAWRRFLESLAAQGPTVLVFEDLHWADNTLLSFLEHLADSADGEPLLLLCVARPELYDHYPTWAAGLRNATAINLPPLTNEETTRLIETLLDLAVLPVETQQLLLERAGGNPLYAEEFVRLLDDRGELSEAVEVPVSVHALIAARLDSLSAERKSLLQDASVVGKVFWVGALAEMGGRDRREVERELDELAGKELVRRLGTSSMEGEAEYGFWHLLVRDVAYGQIPRAARAVRHRAAAAWIEGKARERVEDVADVLAYHSCAALELTRATGQAEPAQELETSALRYLALAGDRALALDVNAAERHFARALELAPADRPDRASLLERWAQVAQQQGRLHEAKEALESALTVRREAGESVAAGLALTTLSNVLYRMGDPHSEQVLSDALALLETQPAGPELVAAYAELAGLRYVGAAYPEALAAAEQALALATQLGLPEPARALGFRGAARCYLGEREGVDDMRRALELALEQGEGRVAGVLHVNMTVASWAYEGPLAAREAAREGIEFGERRGIAEVVLAIAAMAAGFLAELGQTKQALAEVEPVADRLQAANDINFIEARSLHLRLLAERGDVDHVPAPDDLVAAARHSDESQPVAIAFAAAARLLLAQGQSHQAQPLLDRTRPNAGCPHRALLRLASARAPAHRDRHRRRSACRPSRRRRRNAYAARRARAQRLPRSARRSRRRLRLRRQPLLGGG